MYPLLSQTLPVYFLMWVCAAASAIILGTHFARLSEFRPRTSVIASRPRDYLERSYH